MGTTMTNLGASQQKPIYLHRLDSGQTTDLSDRGSPFSAILLHKNADTFGGEMACKPYWEPSVKTRHFAHDQHDILDFSLHYQNILHGQVLHAMWISVTCFHALIAGIGFVFRDSD